MLLCEKNEEDSKRLDTILKFNSEYDLFTKTLIEELIVRINNKPILNLSEVETDLIIELLAKIKTISPSLNNHLEYTASFEKRFEDYLIEFGSYEFAVFSAEASSAFIDEKTLSMGKQLDNLCKEIMIVDNVMNEYYSQFAEFKNSYNACLN